MRNWTVPFLEDIHEFNETFHKPESNYPVIPKNYQFILDTIQEEKDELEEAFKQKDIVEVADALADLLYFVGNGILATGLADRFQDIWKEVQASNMSKVCTSEEEAKKSVDYMQEKKGVAYYYRKWTNKAGKDYWIVYRWSDDKAGKCVNWFEPDLKKFFTQEEIENASTSTIPLSNFTND